MTNIDQLITVLADDMIGSIDGKPVIAVYTQPQQRLLALLIAYSLGEELASNVVSNTNDV